MLIYFTLCIFVLTPCSTLPSVTSTMSTLTERVRELEAKEIPNILSILNALNGPNDGDETDFEETNVPYDESLPKLTIWEFPTERRAFIGDTEIFIDSKEDDQNSHEPIDPLNFFVLHPHKRHGLPKNLGEVKEFPAFKKKTKNSNDEEVNDSVIHSEDLKQIISGSRDETLKYFSNLTRNKRYIKEKRETNVNNHDKSIADSPRNRRRRTWEVNDYLNWLLDEWDKSTSNIPSAVNENQDKGEADNIQAALENRPSDIINAITSAPKITDSPNVVIEKKIQLQPVDPSLIDIMRLEFSDKREKRSINFESDTNLIEDDSNEDDDTDEIFDDFLSVLKTGKDLYRVLIAVYYFDK